MQCKQKLVTSIRGRGHVSNVANSNNSNNENFRLVCNFFVFPTFSIFVLTCTR